MLLNYKSFLLGLTQLKRNIHFLAPFFLNVGPIQYHPNHEKYAVISVGKYAACLHTRRSARATFNVGVLTKAPAGGAV